MVSLPAPLNYLLENSILFYSSSAGLPRSIPEFLSTGSATDAEFLPHLVSDTGRQALPDDLKNDPNAKLLSSIADRKVYDIVHLIYREELRGKLED